MFDLTDQVKKNISYQYKDFKCKIQFWTLLSTLEKVIL